MEQIPIDKQSFLGRHDQVHSKGLKPLNVSSTLIHSFDKQDRWIESSYLTIQIQLNYASSGDKYL